MGLYTLKKWIGNDSSVYDSSQQQQQYTQRREDAEILENLGYKLKHKIGSGLIEVDINSGLDFGCVLGNSNFGKLPALRRRLRKQSIPYALKLVASKFPVATEETPLQEESESGNPLSPKHQATD